jgi:hypothetical protein
MELSLHEFGKMIGLEYGSPEGSAEFVTWVLNRFPPPPVTPRTTSKICSPSDLNHQSISPSPERM